MTKNTSKTLTIPRVMFAAGVLFGAAVGVPVGGMLTAAPAQAQPAVQEDDPGWDCRTMGDHLCGPTNSQSVAAGLYHDGTLVAAWDPAWYGHPELVPDVTFCPADGVWSAEFHQCPAVAQ